MSKGFLFALITALIWGLAPVFEKMGMRGRIDPYLGVVIRTIPITIASVSGLFFMGRVRELATADPRSMVMVILGGLLAGFVGQIAYYSALKHGEASIVVPLAATYPLVTLIISILFLGETVTMQKIAGIALIVGGVALLR